MELRIDVIYSLDLKSLKSHMVDMQIVFFTSTPQYSFKLLLGATAP